MIWAAALGGVILCVVSVRWRRFVFRWGLRALAVTACLSAYLIVGHWHPWVGLLTPIISPLVAAGYLFRGRILARLPRLAKLLRWVPTQKRREFDRAFKDETDDDGKPRIPTVTRYERLEDA